MQHVLTIVFIIIKDMTSLERIGNSKIDSFTGIPLILIKLARCDLADKKPRIIMARAETSLGAGC